jgi:hypothetical protein
LFSFTGELPGYALLYEFFWDGEQKLWIPWSKLVPKYTHNPEAKFYEILVPTVDTVRATWLLKLMVDIRRPVVLVGETGTSKTATIANFLRQMDQESQVSDTFCLFVVVFFFFNFSFLFCSKGDISVEPRRRLLATLGGKG